MNSTSPDRPPRPITERCIGHGEPVERVALSPSNPKTQRIYFRCARPSNQKCPYFRQIFPNLTNPNSLASTAQTTSHPSPTPQNQIPSEAVPNCRCALPSIARTVGKPGVNNGRQFYSCPKPRAQQCGFFEWLKQPLTTTAPNHQPHISPQQPTTETPKAPVPNTPSEPELVPNCRCNVPAVKRVVKKQGPNNGRSFFVCSKPQKTQCRFFDWLPAKEPNSADLPSKRSLHSAASNHQREHLPAEKKHKTDSQNVLEITMHEIDTFKFFLSFSSRPELKEAVKSFEGLNFEKTDMLATEAVYLPLNKLAQFEEYMRATAGVKLEKKFSDQLIPRIEQYFNMEHQKTRGKEITTPLDQILPSIICEKLMDFQWEGVHFAIKRGGRCLIGDDMGLGKTLQAIAVARIYMADWPLLVICPSSLRLNWKEEILRWLEDEIEDEEILVMMTGKDINKPLQRVNIVSYDLIRKVPAHYLKRCQFIIADESHYLKSSIAKRTKAVVPLIKAATRALLLSGTPALSRPVELFSQINSITPVLFPDYHEYVQQYCEAHYGRFGYDVSGASNLQELNLLLRGSILIRRKKEDVLTQLPDKQRQVIWVQTNAGVMKEVRKKTKILEAARKAMDAASSEEQAARLRIHVRTTQTELYLLSGKSKLDAILEFCKDTAESKCKFIVFAHHTLLIDAIDEYLTNKLKLKIIRIDGSTPQQNRQAMCKSFQNDQKCRVALLSITAAGVGLTLTEAKVVLFAELYWNPGSLLQAEDRAHRIGQKDCVLVKYLLGRGTMDWNMWDTVKKKLKVVGHSLTGAASRMEVRNEQDCGKKVKNGKKVKDGDIEKFFKKRTIRSKANNDSEDVIVDSASDSDMIEEQESASGLTIGQENVETCSSLSLPTRLEEAESSSQDIEKGDACYEEDEGVVSLKKERVDADRALAKKLKSDLRSNVAAW